LTPLSILLVLSSALIHSSWNFFTKRGNWPVKFFLWVFLWGTLLYLPFFIGFGIFPAFLLNFPSKLWLLAILSSLIQTIYVISLIEAYRVGDLSLVYPISRSAPLFTQIWAILFLGEDLSIRGMLGIGLVVLGIFVISLKAFPMKKLNSHSQPIASASYLLASIAAITGSIYSVIDKVAVQITHPVFYIWLTDFLIFLYIGLYLLFRKGDSCWKIWNESRKEIFMIVLLQNASYLLILMAMQMSKVSYVVAFRQVSALFGTGLGILFLKESQWKTRISGALILTLGLILIGLAK